LLKRIAITGPESTGKSSLCQQLATHFNDEWVPEVAREFINKLNRPYDEADILSIAKKQINREDELVKNAKQFLFCDTELIVTKIWSEHKYKKCDPWILNQIAESKYSLYLLCNIDLPWEQDTQREHPYLRKYFFDLYLKELKDRKLNFKILRGTGDDRLRTAIELIEKYS
jgi:NadR type nicotinamide-nucleotide adenylyltransferase